MEATASGIGKPHHRSGSHWGDDTRMSSLAMMAWLYVQVHAGLLLTTGTVPEVASPLAPSSDRNSWDGKGFTPHFPFWTF